MISYLIRRLLIGCLTLLLITFLVYGLIRSMPGTPLTTQLAEMDPSKSVSLEDYERMKRIYGLDKPWYQAYFIWVANLTKGDLGRSIARKQPVSRLIRERVGATLLLTVPSLILAYLLSIPMGLWATAQSGTVQERTVSTTLYMLYALPSFVAALYLQLLLAVKLEWLPLMGISSPDYEQLSTFGKAWDIMKHALMPMICFTYGSLAYETRFIKSNMEEVIRQDFIRTARAKGVGPVRVIVHHGFRNTLIPMVTLIGLTLPALLSGAVILERIFSWPGMGSLFFESLRERDYPTIMGLTLMFSILTLLGQLLADILYAIVDPRVTYS
jgi:peptide/nickel transport system permease protein